MSNPYDPQTPARPEYFGGRELVLKVVKERVESAIIHKKSGGILIYGHRGVGKTSLLKKIIDEAKGSEESPTNALTFYRRLARTTNDQELYNILNEELVAQISNRKNLIEKLKNLGKKIEGINLYGIEFSTTDHNEKSSYQIWKSSLSGLMDVDYVLISIDDADFLSIEAIGELKSIVEDTNSVPVLLVISGGILFEAKLVDDYSPVARIFSGASFNIGTLDLKETKEVLEKPLIHESTKWQPEAIKKLHELTAGYPYLIQCLAKACYAENTTITISDVKNHIKDAINIGKSWLDHEIPTASDQDVLSFVKIIKLEKNIIQNVEMGNIGVPPVYIGRLVKLGVLRKISRGRYQLLKSPIIATFEELKRGLPQ
jgi:GTPase SAR1 family protein